jgi:hypothetical protein
MEVTLEVTLDSVVAQCVGQVLMFHEKEGTGLFHDVIVTSAWSDDLLGVFLSVTHMITGSEKTYSCFCLSIFVYGQKHIFMEISSLCAKSTVWLLLKYWRFVYCQQTEAKVSL